MNGNKFQPFKTIIIMSYEQTMLMKYKPVNHEQSK